MPLSLVHPYMHCHTYLHTCTVTNTISTHITAQALSPMISRSRPFLPPLYLSVRLLMSFPPTPPPPPLCPPPLPLPPPPMPPTVVADRWPHAARTTDQLKDRFWLTQRKLAEVKSLGVDGESEGVLLGHPFNKDWEMERKDHLLKLMQRSKAEVYAPSPAPCLPRPCPTHPPLSSTHPPPLSLTHTRSLTHAPPSISQVLLFLKSTN